MGRKKYNYLFHKWHDIYVERYTNNLQTKTPGANNQLQQDCKIQGQYTKASHVHKATINIFNLKCLKCHL